MTIIGWAVTLYAGASAVAWAAQRTMMYPAPKQALEPQLESSTLLRIPGRDGRTVYALHAPGPEGTPTVVHFHGNAEALADQAWLAAALRGAGVGVLAVEYPGYGLASDYSTTEEAVYQDAEAAIRYLRDELGVTADATVVSGQSLGTGVAVEMARRGHAGRLVLLSPFTSMVAMGRRIAPILPMRLIVRDRYDSLAKAAEVRVPSLVVFGGADDLIPASMSRRIAEVLDARVLEIDGAGHNDLFERAGRQIVSDVAAFARGE